MSPSERLARIEALEEAAKIAADHKPDRVLKGKPLSYYDAEDRAEIVTEERGERIAGSCIAMKIRELAERS